MGKTLSQFQQGQRLPGGITATPQPHPGISSWAVFYKSLEDRAVSFRKILTVSAYLPSHASLTDVSTFNTAK